MSLTVDSERWRISNRFISNKKHLSVNQGLLYQLKYGDDKDSRSHYKSHIKPVGQWVVCLTSKHSPLNSHEMLNVMGWDLSQS